MMDGLTVTHSVTEKARNESFDRLSQKKLSAQSMRVLRTVHDLTNTLGELPNFDMIRKHLPGMLETSLARCLTGLRKSRYLVARKNNRGTLGSLQQMTNKGMEAIGK